MRVAAAHTPSAPWEEKHKAQPTCCIALLPGEPALRRGTAWHGMAWYGTVQHGVAWCGTAAHDSTAASGRAVIKRPFVPCSRVSLQFKPLELVPEGSHLPSSVIPLAAQRRAPNPMAEHWGHTGELAPTLSPCSILLPPSPPPQQGVKSLSRYWRQCSGPALPCQGTL